MDSQCFSGSVTHTPNICDPTRCKCSKRGSGSKWACPIDSTRLDPPSPSPVAPPARPDEPGHVSPCPVLLICPFPLLISPVYPILAISREAKRTRHLARCFTWLGATANTYKRHYQVFFGPAVPVDVVAMTLSAGQEGDLGWGRQKTKHFAIARTEETSLVGWTEFSLFM